MSTNDKREHPRREPSWVIQAIVIAIINQLAPGAVTVMSTLFILLKTGIIERNRLDLGTILLLFGVAALIALISFVLGIRFSMHAFVRMLFLAFSRSERERRNKNWRTRWADSIGLSLYALAFLPETLVGSQIDKMSDAKEGIRRVHSAGESAQATQDTRRPLAQESGDTRGEHGQAAVIPPGSSASRMDSIRERIIRNRSHRAEGLPPQGQGMGDWYRSKATVRHHCDECEPPSSSHDEHVAVLEYLRHLDPTGDEAREHPGWAKLGWLSWWECPNCGASLHEAVAIEQVAVWGKELGGWVRLDD